MALKLYSTSIYLFLLSFLFLSFSATATHNRAGEITIEQTGDLTIRATITTYTKTSSIPADRDSLEICWGDGNCEFLMRNNGNGEGEPMDNDIKYNTYIGTHTYPGRATYNIGMKDPNRNAGILNVNSPNSDNIAFFLQTTFTFLNPQFQGYNNSPLLLQPPIDVAYIGQPFIHNPNAFDQEGDSLAYELIIPKMDVDLDVSNYSFPDAILPGPDNMISLDELTGDFLWDSPQKVGEYNIAILIKEYRAGSLISTIIRDMQVRVLEGNNQPPEIETIDEICVIAGETINFEVIATDPDIPEQQIELTALGGPFQLLPNPAVFTAPTGFQPQPVIGNFIWTPPCEVISDQYYSVVFKALDDFGFQGLSTLKTVRIKVVGPPPEDLQATPGSGEVDLNWESPYDCEITSNDYFQGFSVWRRSSTLDMPLDTCDPGIDGYTLLALDVKDLNSGRYFYKDTDVERGRSYCYRVVGEFAQTSAGSNPYNRVQSLRSEEVCVQLSRDIPLITHVSVQSTDTNNGSIEIKWSKPIAEDLDTLQNPGPYTYEVWRVDGFNTTGLTPIPGASFTSSTFAGANDTTFIDTGLNTLDQPYSYQIAFYVNGESEPLGFTNVASSVYLSIASTDELNILSWEEYVPWENYEYVIYRETSTPGVFDSIGISETQEYYDEGLINEVEYCYYVKSVGTYSIGGIEDPLYNLSQENCGTPIDTIPPCPPELMIENICDIAGSETPSNEFENTLTWTNPNHICTDDVLQYNIYFSPNEGTNPTIIETLNNAEDTTYIHQPSFISIAGCYMVTAIDSVGNESEFSNQVCVDNCPYYELPNVFTPNGDGDNDLFIPFPYRFIDHIDLEIFNQWGGKVFETSDPAILWDGTNLQGKDLSEGTYFYICKVFENRVGGVLPRQEPLSGYIHLFRGE